MTHHHAFGDAGRAGSVLNEGQRVLVCLRLLPAFRKAESKIVRRHPSQSVQPRRLDKERFHLPQHRLGRDGK